MAIGKSRRIVIDVEDVTLKRDLYAVLAAEGRSLKEWFSAAAHEYLDKSRTTTPQRPALVAERRADYRTLTGKGTQ